MMAMPAPPAFRSPGVEPRLRLVRWEFKSLGRETPSIARKLAWTLAGFLLGMVIIVVARAQTEREIPPDQRWFWDPEWLTGELEADRDILQGRLGEPMSDSGMLDILRQHRHPQ